MCSHVGRNLWASLTTSSRQLAMLIWLHVRPTSRPPTPTADSALNDADVIPGTQYPSATQGRQSRQGHRRKGQRQEAKEEGREEEEQAHGQGRERVAQRERGDV